MAATSLLHLKLLLPLLWAVVPDTLEGSLLVLEAVPNSHLAMFELATVQHIALAPLV